MGQQGWRGGHNWPGWSCCFLGTFSIFLHSHNCRVLISRAKSAKYQVEWKIYFSPWLWKSLGLLWWWSQLLCQMWSGFLGGCYLCIFQIAIFVSTLDTDNGPMRRHKTLILTHWKCLSPISSHFPLLWVSLWKSWEGCQDLVGASWTALGVALFALFVLFVPFGRSTGLDFLAGHPLPHRI